MRLFFEPVHALIVFAAACGAGAINAVAGGGTLITFPTLVWLGVPSITANATNAVSLWPGSLASAWGYRRELAGVERGAFLLTVPSIAGALIGAILLDLTPTATFDRLVPVLILFATGLFMAQEPLQRRFNLVDAHRAGRSPWSSWTMPFQLAVAIYGGYFGAGMGILMLAALTLMGHTDIHRMNGVKNLLSAAINGTAAIYFAFNTTVIWSDALVMAVGSMVGGLAGAGLARRIGRDNVRRLVVAIGFVSALAMAL